MYGKMKCETNCTGVQMKARLTKDETVRKDCMKGASLSAILINRLACKRQ